MRLRQIALVGEDLAQARADITAVLGLGPDYADPGVGKYGLHNAVWPVGDTFLEVVSPLQPGTTAGRLIEKRGGDGGYMAIFQCDDIAEARTRIAAAGVRIVDQHDRDGVCMTHLHPRDLGGAIVSIDSMEPKARWEWGGPGWEANVRTEVALEIIGCELQGDDPEGMALRWSSVLGAPATFAGDHWRIATEGGELRFVTPADGRGEGLGAFDVRVRNVEAVLERARARGCVDARGDVVLCGTRVRLV